VTVEAIPQRFSGLDIDAAIDLPALTAMRVSGKLGKKRRDFDDDARGS